MELTKPIDHSKPTIWEALSIDKDKNEIVEAAIDFLLGEQNIEPSKIMEKLLPLCKTPDELANASFRLGSELVCKRCKIHSIFQKP